MKEEKIKNDLGKRSIGKWALIIIFLIVVILFLLFDLFLARGVWDRQIDDYSSQIECDSRFVDKSETLMVIPLFNNVSIAENKTWCKQTLALNKTLGMHGVYHNYQEFLEPRSEEYIQVGMEEFKKCFGYYPTLFEAPHLALGSENKQTLFKMGFEIRNWGYTLTHKVYHCQDKGIFATRITSNFNLTNNFIDKI